MTAGGDYMAEIEANLVETRQVGDANQGHVTAYASAAGHHGQPWSLSNNSVAQLQNPHKMVYGSTENGHGSTFAYRSDQQRDTTVSSEAPKGSGTPLYTPAASSAPPGVPSQQEYSGYMSYQYSTSSHGYTSSEYANNYYGYQQPANDSSHQQVGMAQNTGAPYQSLSSFQNASPYAGSASYSGTYYNPGDYQTTSGYQTTTMYPSSGYSNQSTLWNGGTGGNAPPYGYSSYPSSETNVGHQSSTTVENPLQYQQQYGHWGGYYGQTASSNALCAPGTENMPVIGHNTVENQAPNSSGGYPYASNQPPPPGTTSWRYDLTPPPLSASQGNKDHAGCNQAWRAGEHGYQTQHPKQPTLYSQKHLDSNHFSHSRSEDQQGALNTQSSNSQFPLTNQVSQNFQTPTQTAPMTNIYQSSRIQIPTNPRIASNMVIGMPKADTESTAAGTMQKPVYISVAIPRPNNKEPTQDSSDNKVKGTLPPSLRAYVERTFARCRDDSQRAANQDIMKEMITKASADGTLLTRNWDIEPLFSLPDTSLRKSDNNLPNSTPFSQLPKHRKSPSRRAKSRWEPLPEEKLAERTQPANHIPLMKNVKWDQPKDNNKVANPPILNGKDKGWGNTVFVPAQQQVLSSNNMLRPPKRQRFGDSNRDESGDASSDSDKEHGLTKYYSSAIALADSPEERKKRECRVKRFEKGQGHQSGLNFRQKSAGSGTLYARRTDLLQAKTFEDNGNRAVEDIAWDSLTVRGTCQEIEKRYLRLTSAPDPASVRPEDVVQKALLMVQSSQKNYLYKCDQLKSIRQDLTVQRIQNELTVQVYETHARLALEAGDLAEYNQCQSQLKSLYSEGIKGLHSEFSAYNLLHVIFQQFINYRKLGLYLSSVIFNFITSNHSFGATDLILPPYSNVLYCHMLDKHIMFMNFVGQGMLKPVLVKLPLLCNICFMNINFRILNKSSFFSGHEMLLVEETRCSNATSVGYMSPKLYELIQIFLSFGKAKEILCLIFVERKITAKVIQRFIKKLSYLSHFEVSYLTGGATSLDALSQKMQKETLDLFRSGKVNLLFATDVAEEGIHVPNCSCVIRFDLPKTVRSYVQSRGRAREANSDYIIMLERGNIDQTNLLIDIIRSEHSMMGTVLSSDLAASIGKPCCEELNLYTVESTGATVTAHSSVSLIFRYCEQLPRDNYFHPKPHFSISKHSEYFECTLTLPPNAAFQTLIGPLNKNSHLARQLVCLEACRKLHQMGALNDHLLTSCKGPIEGDQINEKKKFFAGAGTTKRKELHGTVPIRDLSGTWAINDDDVTLKSYKLSFSSDEIGQNYSSFVLLIDATLDNDFASMDLDLYLIDAVVKTSISPCGNVHMDSEKVRKSKLFQELFFNGLFGKLFTGTKYNGKPRQFLLTLATKASWKTSNMYLLLPLDNSSPDHESLEIDWKAIDACISIVEYISSIYPPHSDYSSNGLIGSPILLNNISGKTKSGVPNTLHLSQQSLRFSDVKNKVVLAIHTAKIYSVVDVMVDMSSNSPFEESSAKGTNFISYSDYFNEKYGISLQYPEQPLLRLKHSHNPHNLLSITIPKVTTDSANLNVKETDDMVSKKPRYYAHMPPELLLHIDVRIEVLKSCYLLPSVMHRLESLMLASQLKREIASSSACQIPCSLILEAITTQRCCERFSLERLEFLGDSVLKYVVSCNLFLKFPQTHEGQLSASRSHAVSNATLHNLGIAKNLQGYIRDSAFDPRRWVAPGQICLHPVDCNCRPDDFDGPFKIMYDAEENSVVMRKPCDNGHRWLCSKTISDCVEALIGAYFIADGLDAACSFMKWIGMDVDCDTLLVEEAIKTASLRCYLPKIVEIESLESKLNYKFYTKGLLLEAITHGSDNDLLSYCYQRLEFLGDSVLGLLLTIYLFKLYGDIGPGELTELRSVSVSNESFAQVAVRHKIYPYLQHSSALLQQKITDYVKACEKFYEEHNMQMMNCLTKVPKVLGDMVESIAGAILVDSSFDMDRVWQIFETLLSPIVTPDSLEYPAHRELIEVCARFGYFISTKVTTEGDKLHAELGVQLEDALLVREGSDGTAKAAKGQAASLLLKDLKERGLLHTKHTSKRKHQEVERIVESIPTPEHKPTKSLSKKQKTVDADSDVPKGRELNEVNGVQSSGPVLLSLKLTKGGPRMALYELSKKCQWPMPSFTTTEAPTIVSGTNSGIIAAKNGVKHFVSKITLHMPNHSTIELTGDHRLDKKSSQDSAAIAMLKELQKLGRCQITELT